MNRIALNLFLSLALIAAGCGDEDAPAPDDPSTGATLDPADQDGSTSTPADDVEQGEPAPPSELSGSVVINEVVMYSPDGKKDWVELYNPGSQSIEVGGWTLTDEDPEHVATLAEGTSLEPGGFLVLEQDAADGFAFGLGGTDAVRLFDSNSGGIVDEVSWQDLEVTSIGSLGRFPDGSGEFIVLPLATPGSANLVEVEASCGNSVLEPDELCDGEDTVTVSCQHLGYFDGQVACGNDCVSWDQSACTLPNSSIIINEVSASDQDFIEVLNVSDESVNIGDWQISDSNPDTEGHTLTFAAGTTLTPGDYLVLSDEALTFGLGKKDLVTLHDASGSLKDIASWLGGDADISYCRQPDGEGPLRACGSATPGAQNSP